MSEWIQQFENHELHSTLNELDSILTELESSELTSVAETESLNRIRQVSQLLKSTLAAVDPNLVAQSSLATLKEFVDLQVRNLNQYKSTQNSSLLTNPGAIDSILTQLSTLHVPRVAEDVEGLREALTTFRRSMGQHARQLENEYEKINQEFKTTTKSFFDLTEEIKSQKQRLDTAISQFQQQFSEAESKRREEYTQEANNTRTELNKILQQSKEEITLLTTSSREQFNTAESERKQQYEVHFENVKVALTAALQKSKKDLDSLTDEHKTKFSSLIEEVKTSRTAMETDLNSQVDDYIKQLEMRKAEAEKLVQVIGNTGMVGGYQKVANQERTSAWIWHGLTLIFMSGLIAFAIVAFLSTIQGDFRLGVFGARAFVAIAFGIGVAWAAREAEKHQQAERRNRKMELELASISPYLALLPDDTQFAVKTELAQRLFGQSEPILQAKNDKEVTGTTLDLLKMALEILSKK